jgi:hypothetical protein
MFCVNCGANVQVDAVFCSNCGIATTSEAKRADSAQALVNAQFVAHALDGAQPKDINVLTILTSRLFAIFFEILLWLVLLFGFIGGAIIGGNTYDYSPGIGAFMGLVVGGLISFGVMVFIGGMISTFIKISDNIEAIKQSVYLYIESSDNIKAIKQSVDSEVPTPASGHGQESFFSKKLEKVALKK